MTSNLNFQAGYYEITQLIPPNVIEVNETWFVQLDGVEDAEDEELNRWLKKGNIVRIVPLRRNSEARIISEVWLGRVHINRQFSNYTKQTG